MIALLGDVLVDIVALTHTPLAFASDTPAEIRMTPGGSAAGTAAWLAHDGYPVRLLGAVGDDVLAEIACGGMSGVDLAIQRVPGQRTGSCVVVVDPAGERTMLPDAGACGLWRWSRDDIHGASHLHISAYPLFRDGTRSEVLQAMASAREAGVSLSLDLASSAPLAQNVTVAREAVENCDLVFANADEAAVLTGLSDPESALELLAAMAATAVVKLGSHGCLARSGSTRVSAAALAADVIDTTGAGDAFTAGFLPVWLTGADLETCVHSGQASAVRTLNRVGAGPPTPRA